MEGCPKTNVLLSYLPRLVDANEIQSFFSFLKLFCTEKTPELLMIKDFKMWCRVF